MMDERSPRIRNTTRDRIVNGHIWTTVWWLAWPSVITMLLQTANGLVDAVFVGRLGATALSAVGLASQVMMILMSVSTAISVGTTALVARFVGADDPTSAEYAVRQSILIAVGASLLSGLLTYALGPSLIGAMGGEGDSLRMGVTYLNILLLGVTPFFLMFVLTGVFRGIGDMRTPLIVMSAVTAVSLLGDWLLIFGVGPFPRLEIVGAGIATVLSRIVSTVMFLAFLPRSALRRALRGSWRPDYRWFARILNIGTPAAIQGLLRTGASMTYFAILGMTRDGIIAIAALTIGLRTEALAFMPGFAFSVAATSMVGQNLGAGQAERAEKGAWAAAWQGIWVMGAIGVIFIAFADPIASAFTNDRNVIPFAASYLRINGLSEPFLALSMILTGALQGAGETRVPTAVTILTLWIIRLPLTYYLAVTLGLAAMGAWIAMSASTVLSGLAMLAVFKLVRWQERRV